MGVGRDPGEYVLVIDKSLRAPWPGLIFPHDQVPRGFLKRRQSKLRTPVLLMGKLEFIWVLENSMADFPPEVEDELRSTDPNLYNAYMVVFDDKRPFPELSYWTNLIQMRQSEMSDDARPLTSRSNPLASPRPTNEKKRKRGPSPSKHISTPGGRPQKLPLQRPQGTSPAAQSEVYPSTTINPIASAHSAPAHEPNSNDQGNSAGTSFALTLAGASVAHRLPVSPPPTEGSFREDNAGVDPNIVRFIIGKTNKEFHVPLAAIQGNEDREALKRIMTWENGRGYTIRRPQYDDIRPEHFMYVADFLTKREFGISLGDIRAHDPVPLAEDTELEVMQQCQDAWKLAQELQLEDMMGVIIQKLEALRPWKVTILGLARVVFPDHEEFVTETEERLQEMLAEFVVEDYDGLLEEHHSILKEKMDTFPCLGYLVHSKLAARYQERRGQISDPDIEQDVDDDDEDEEG